jgi:hypothetical protein
MLLECGTKSQDRLDPELLVFLIGFKKRLLYTLPMF